MGPASEAHMAQLQQWVARRHITTHMYQYHHRPGRGSMLCLRVRFHLFYVSDDMPGHCLPDSTSC
jgi:hypothetical protein